MVGIVYEVFIGAIEIIPVQLLALEPPGFIYRGYGILPEPPIFEIGRKLGRLAIDVCYPEIIAGESLTAIVQAPDSPVPGIQHGGPASNIGPDIKPGR